MTIDPSASYRGERTCRVKGCQQPAVTVVPLRFRFPSADSADDAGNAVVQLTLVLCREHTADSSTALRDQTARIGRSTLPGAGVRAFERYIEKGDRGAKE